MNDVFLPELLAPAGNMEKLHTCLLYGADAVYLGGKTGNLRAACEGFSSRELREAVIAAEQKRAKIYYCLNSLPLQDDMPLLPRLIEEAAEAGVHGFIIADPGVLRLARRHAPQVPVHLSTQANTTNSEAVAFWAGQGVERVNLARELSARDIYAVRRACPDMRLEVFVHGAMCLAVSGQCLLSAWLNARSGNQGRCTQPCRFEYRALGQYLSGEDCFPDALVVEEYTRPGEPVWRVEQDDRYSSFWATQDLCLLPWLSWFINNRIDALKVEGRMKSSGYLAHTVDAYRTALDAAGQGAKKTPEGCLTELLYAATRPLGSGFFLHGRRKNLTEEFLEASGLASRPNRSREGRLPELGHALLAKVVTQKALGVWQVEVHGNWRRGMDVELMLPGLRRPVLIGGSYGLENQRGELTDIVGNGVTALLYTDTEGLESGIFLRRAF
ncbi:MAG: U32 family peptidase [Desulfovibrionaceae bacterium]|nr:U32 family peptidase [Desulfovibrionaceae bacterium]